MALYVKQDQQRSELRERIAAEMRAKAAAAQQDEPAATPAPHDSVESFNDGTKTSSPLLAVWIIVTIAAVVAILWLIVNSQGQPGI
jgi:hypothetical protein